MTITEKVVIGGLLVAGAGLIAMNLTVSSAFESLTESSDGVPARVAPVYSATVRATHPPVVFSKDQAVTYDRLGLTDEQRVKMARIETVAGRRQLDAWSRVREAGRNVEQRREELLRLREIMAAAQEDLRRELGDKWSAYEELRAERMGMSKRPDASAD